MNASKQSIGILILRAFNVVRIVVVAIVSSENVFTLIQRSSQKTTGGADQVRGYHSEEPRG
jgi:hypothetical protein